MLQYRWLGQISDAERAQRRSTLAAGALEFAQDFDREVTRAYLLFQTDAPMALQADDEALEARFSARYDRWQATARFPRLLKEFYAFSQDQPDRAGLRRFNPATRRLEPVDWPEAMSKWSEQLTPGTWKDSSSAGNSFFIRRMPAPIWESAPAIVVPTPVILFGESRPGARMAAAMLYSLLMIDRDYVARELLPSLAEQHFGHRGGEGHAVPGLDFKVAVVSRATPDTFVFQSTPSFAPALDAPADATADLFQVRTAGLSAARRRGPPVHGIGSSSTVPRLSPVRLASPSRREPRRAPCRS